MSRGKIDFMISKMSKNLVSQILLLGIFFLISCTTPTDQQLSAKIATNVSSTANQLQAVDCQEAEYNCPPNQVLAPYLCSAYNQTDRVLAWGRTACLAKRNLLQKSCKMGIPVAQLGKLNCIPDPSRGECPVERGACTFEYSPASCRAARYDGRKLSWDLMPTTWGSNACQARQKLQEEACHSGLVPSLMQDINCEPDSSEGACPPKSDCDDTKTDPVVCTVERYGEQVLEKPWTVFAPSQCQAKQQLQKLACRYANQENQLKPSLLGPIQCESPPKD